VAARRTKGEGSIYFSSNINRWVAQITLPNGKRISKSSKIQKDVREWLIDQRKQLKDGLYITDEHLKLGVFLDRYLQDVAFYHLRPRTYERYTGIINNHIKPEIGNIKLSALRPHHIQALYSKKLNSGLSINTVRYIHAVLHKALFQALKWGLVARNVSDLVDKPKTERKIFKTWSPYDVKLFLEAVEQHRWYPIYILAIYTGLRQGELLGIHREDVDLEKGTINVCRQISVIRGKGLMIADLKTEKSRRLVTLPASALRVLREYIDIVGIQSGLIFTTSTGKPISPRNLLRHFKATIEASGLPQIRFHDLRHTHASLLLAAGVHPKVVQERLGHSQISLTLDTYSHLIPSMQTEAAKQFEAILG
jgi:integrase